jgi:enoyl-CoA hydratase
MENVSIERDGFLAVVTVTRPSKLNALDDQTIAELSQAVADLSADCGIGAVILTGAGEKAFVAGADIGVLSKQGVVDGRDNALRGQALTTAIERSGKPFLAAINGYALGGGLELALACDMRFAASTARLGLPEVSLGIIPGYGGTQRLPRLVGSGLASQMILTGDPITADEAVRIGLVNAAFAPEELLEKTKAIALKIISRGPNAVALAKEAIRRGGQMALEEGLQLEADLFGVISSTDEMREGMAAFLEKRKAGWVRS